MLEICVQSGNWYDEKDPEGSFSFIRECGFDGIDYNMDSLLRLKDKLEGKPTPFFNQSIEKLLEYYKPMKEAAQRNHVAICQIHAPFPLYAEGYEEINDYMIMAVDKCCAISRFLECPAIVVHPFTHPDKAVEREINLEMYRRMIPAAKAYGIKLCLENLFANDRGHLIEGACADVHEACWYIDTLNKMAGEERFGFCLDVGHANLVGRNIREYIKQLGERLTLLHIHDNNGNTDDHMIPYTQSAPGGVDWNRFMEGLRLIAYTGALSFETFHGIEMFPDDVKMDGLKLVSCIGQSFRKQLMRTQENSTEGE